MSSDTASTSTPSALSASSDALTGRAVRFEQECALIPEPVWKSRRPRLVMKSYSLPLWNRKSGGSAVSDSEVDDKEEGLFLKVSVPKFISGSPTMTRERSDEAPPSPLQSCLVRNEPGSPRSPRLRRQCSTPLPPRADLLTIPLRSCCLDCYPVTEESLKEGMEWKERFSRGARRRRNSSVSSDESFTRYGESVHHGCLQGKVLSVDEVDKRKRSSESADDGKRGRDPAIVSLNDEEPGIRRCSPSPGLGINTSSLPRASPIMEENEDELFPLPSPRRSPQNSPTGSTSCLSPKEDSDSIVRSPLQASSSNESLSGAPSKPSPTMKKCGKGFLAPDPSLWLPSPTTDSPPSLPSPALPSPPASAPPHPRASKPIDIPASFSRREPSSSSDVSDQEYVMVGTSPRGISPETRTKRRSSLQLHMHIPGPASLLRAGADVLKGVGFVGGAPMSS
ncbi:hypothetical protein OE88DRAFT_1664952 [Heliocybe sulcata]|uniref:Uncharacterized protein n=1 Tax=Heliocybe sulcata TaxID=5364 RepID=A0A5C3N2I3_9AGAM|nr:hypothetical protein OE88DRAFT_1664952 [Heliocybe sulcata]